MPRYNFHSAEGVEQRTCKCGQPYFVDELTKWKTMCLDCWKKQKREEERQRDEFQKRRQQEKTNENYQQRQDKERAERERRARDFFREEFFGGFGGSGDEFFRQYQRQQRWKEDDSRHGHSKQQSGSELERQLKENIRVLIQLCHPDKHNNSDASKRITQWLLEIKGKM